MKSVAWCQPPPEFRWSRSFGKDNPKGRAGLKDRKSTRLNSSHRCISYAVFCLKKTNRLDRGSGGEAALRKTEGRGGADAAQPDSHFFFNDTATTEIYTLSLHDALPI